MIKGSRTARGKRREDTEYKEVWLDLVWLDTKKQQYLMKDIGNMVSHSHRYNTV